MYAAHFRRLFALYLIHLSLRPLREARQIASLASRLTRDSEKPVEPKTWSLNRVFFVRLVLYSAMLRTSEGFLPCISST